MANVHNTFIRALNSIYLQAPYITTPALASDFLEYCRCLGPLIKLHHDAEIQLLFPQLEKMSEGRLSMSDNVHQHEAFHSQLDAFNRYSSETRPEDFSGEKMRELLDALAPGLLKHLREEIPTLMQFREYGEAVRKLHGEFEVYVRKHVDNVSLFGLHNGATGIG